MSFIQSVALAGGMAWASGMRLYAVLLSAGVLSRFQYLTLPADLQVLENPWIMGLSGALLLVEFLADKIPVVDSIWDSVHTFIRIPAGAVLAALAMGEHDPAVMFGAGLLGGTLTAGTHAAKTGSRFAINTSPEPVTNIAASLSEDAIVATGLYLAIAHPVLFLVLLGFFVLLLIWLLPKLIRTIRSMMARVIG